MPKINIYRSVAAITLLILFFATIVGRDFYHLLGHKDEVSCGEHDNSAPHFHELEKCNICDHNFSAGKESEVFSISGTDFVFLRCASFYKHHYNLDLFFQNPDTRGSPISA